MPDINRRTFLKGTGKTLLTGAVVGTVGVSGTTTPIKPVIPPVKTLNVLSPKAKAYKTFIKGIGATYGFGKQNRKSLITKDRIGTGKKQAIAGQSPARKAFESSIRKGDQGARELMTEFNYAKGGDRTKVKYATSFETDRIAHKINPNPQKNIPPEKRNIIDLRKHSKSSQRISEDIHRRARTTYTKELRLQRALKKKMRTKSKGGSIGGGGKMAIPAMESARNPTGMGLITRRSILM